MTTTLEDQAVMQDIIERLYSRLSVSEFGCFEFTGYINPFGYGRISIHHRQRYTHRVAWEISHGAASADYVVAHLCDNRRCFNVSHLTLMTHKVNIQDARVKGRLAHGPRSQWQAERMVYTNSKRWKKQPKQPRLSLRERLLSHVSLGDNGCWEWEGTINNRSGYGQIGIGQRSRWVHRVAWQVWHGQEVPAGNLVRHTCDNRRCIAPAHLVLGTHADNMADMVARSRAARGDHNRATHAVSRPRGERHGMARLSAEQVTVIRALCGRMKQRDIAAQFGISQLHVSRIHRGISWAHLPMPEAVHVTD